MIKLVNIHKLYETESGGFLALKDVNLDFKEQEFVCVLGKSGSGKTTLLNIIGGLDKPSAGHMVINGALTTKFTERQWDYFRNYKIGFIFQNYSLIEHLTVLDNVMLSVKLQGESNKEAKERALKLLDQVGVLDQANKLPKHLSGGQRQRVAIARALVNNPEVILADEPTGALDKKNSQEVLDILKKLSQDKLVIMVTHNRRLANIYADRIIELKDGMVDKDSRPEVIEKVKIKKNEKLLTTFKFVDKLKHGLKNLRMKKVRTFLTALGLSIGVIGYILIDALSNGVKTNMKKQEYAYANDPHFQITHYSDEILDLDERRAILDRILRDDRIKAAHIGNAAQFMMTGLDDDPFAHPSSINLIYPFLSDKNETFRYFGKLHGDGRWPEADNEIAITKDVAMKLLNYSNTATLWEKLKGSELFVGTDYYLTPIVSETIHGCTAYPYVDEETVPEGYEGDLESFQSHLQRQKELFKVPIIQVISKGYYDAREHIYICDDYTKLPVQQGEVKASEPFKIVGIIESSHIENSVVSRDAYENMFILPEMIFDRDYLGNILRNDNSYMSTFDVYVHDHLSDDEKSQLKAELAKDFDYVLEYYYLNYSPPGSFDIITFILNIIMFVSVITAGLMLLMVLFISVMERSREIGILRSLGATKSDILSIFTVESGLLGFFAGILGIVLSIAVSFGANIFIRHRYEDRLIEMFNRADIDLFIIKPVFAIVAAIICIIFAIIFGLIPAIQASKKSPINALRRIK